MIYAPIRIRTGMTMVALCCAAIWIGHAAAEDAPPAATSQPATAPLNPQQVVRRIAQDAGTLKGLGEVLLDYQRQHKGVLPHDLGALLAFKKDADASLFVSPGDRDAHPAPDKLTADWVNENASFQYFAADADITKIPRKDYGLVAIAYTKSPLSAGKKFLINYLFLDGHVEAAYLDQSPQEMGNSAAVLQKVAVQDKDKE
jgi:prepilin-type processing-associated H-X9-DG protein